MRQYILPVLLMLSASAASAQQYSLSDTTFFDKDWQPCSRDAHEYFRIVKLDNTTMPPMKLLKLIDHYKDGKVQMDGYVLEDDTSKRAGLYRWYSKKGKLEEARLIDYQNSMKYFEASANYLTKADVCNVSDADISVRFKRGRVKYIGFIVPAGSLLDTCSCNRICTYREYLGKDLFASWDYKNGKLDGRYLIYHSNGAVWVEKYYKDGKRLEGKRKYSRSGRLKKTKGTPV